MIIYRNGDILDFARPLYANKEIAIGIDSSKTNSAIVVGDMGGNILDYIELDGSKEGTKEIDTLRLCQAQRLELKVLFRAAKPKIVGIENIITKNNDTGSTGMTKHMSRFKITAVFMSLISFFQDNFEVTPVLVNNQTWKSVILPEEFCKRKYAKGSLAYFQSIDSKYGRCSDDVTDALCILEYLYIINKVSRGHIVKNAEAPRYNYIYYLISTLEEIDGKTKKYLYNTEFTLNQNAIVMANSLMLQELGVAVIQTAQLTLYDLYTFCKGEFQPREDSIRLIVKRVQ